jgi:HD superfamily phosphohydrolase
LHFEGKRSRVDDNWDEITLIRDSVYGYIPIPKLIMKHIVDKPEYQRLKDIQQTAMGALYPSATHNRFLHSLGVFHLGVQAFDCFRKNIESQDFLRSEIGDVPWGKWRMLFALACILHDCGHSAFSHTLEFVYDMNFSGTTNAIVQPENCASIWSTDELSRFFKTSKTDFSNQVKISQQNGSPHERMSACYVTKEPFRNEVIYLIESWAKYDAGRKGTDAPSPVDHADDLEFICRSILGIRYHNDQLPLERQLRNCIIALLNSKLDVDNLDYTIRDAKVSGYDSQEIDVPRLLSAFTAVPAIQLDNSELTDLEINGPVECISFSGQIKAGIYGECHLDANSGTITATGKLAQAGDEVAPTVGTQNQRIFVTTEDFEASCVSGDLSLKSVWNSDKKSYVLNPDEKSSDIFIKGKIESGCFTGILFGERVCKTLKSSGTLLLFPAFNKNCMSVLHSAIEARNFEYEWIYAHHTIAYECIFLIPQMFDRYVNVITNYHRKEILSRIEKKLSIFKKAAAEVYPKSSVPSVASGESETENTVWDYCFGVLNVCLKADYGSLAAIEPFDFDSTPGINDAFPKAAEIIGLLKRTFPKPPWRKMSDETREIVCALSDVFTKVILLLQGKDPSEYAKYRRTLELLSDILNQILSAPSLTKPGEELMAMFHETMRYAYCISAKGIGLMFGMLAPAEPMKFGKRLGVLSRSTDHDLLMRFRDMMLDQSLHKGHLKPRESAFYSLANEYFSRRQPTCAWKTQAEFRHLFRGWSEAELNFLFEAMENDIFPPANADDTYLHAVELNDTCCENMVRPLCKIWNVLKLFFNRCVWITVNSKPKVLPPTKTLIKFGENVLRLRDVELGPETKTARKFGYLYYELKDRISPDRVPNDVIEELHKFICESLKRPRDAEKISNAG